MSVIFTRGATSVTLGNPVAEYAPERPPRQRVGISGGGAVKVAILGPKDTIFKMSFKRQEPEVGTALVAFIDDTIQDSAYPFTLTDWNSVVTENTIYITGRDTWKQGRGGKWSGSLTMRKGFGS